MHATYPGREALLAGDECMMEMVAHHSVAEAAPVRSGNGVAQQREVEPAFSFVCDEPFAIHEARDQVIDAAGNNVARYAWHDDATLVIDTDIGACSCYSRPRLGHRRPHRV